MIKISPHGQIFLDYLIGLYMVITVSWNRGLRDLYLSHDAQNHFPSKRTPIIKELCSGFWSFSNLTEVNGIHRIGIQILMLRIRMLQMPC